MDGRLPMHCLAVFLVFLLVALSLMSSPSHCRISKFNAALIFFVPASELDTPPQHRQVPGEHGAGSAQPDFRNDQW